MLFPRTINTLERCEIIIEARYFTADFGDEVRTVICELSRSEWERVNYYALKFLQQGETVLRSLSLFFML